MTNLRLVNEHALALAREVCGLAAGGGGGLDFNEAFRAAQEAILKYDEARARMERRLRPLGGGPRREPE